MKNTYIDGFALALGAFDRALDEFARNSASNRAYSYDWASAEPLEEGKHYTINRTCGCGSNCSSCGNEKSKAKVRFDDILDDIEQVIFNDPATIVTFSDGSKVCVKACAKDTFNKETGLIYALIKRLYANDIDEDTGYLVSRGLGDKIGKIVKSAVDQKENERIRRAGRKAKKEKKAALESAKKADLANEVSEQAAKEAVEQIYEEDDNKQN